VRRFALCLLLLPASVLAEGVALDYEVRYGPLTILEMRTTATLDDAGYETSSEVRTVGVVGMLFPWTAGATTRGARAAAVFRPRSHRSHGEYRGTQRRVEIDYDDAAVQARVEPPAETDARETVPAAAQQDTIDPLTASLAAIESGCGGTLRIFDGRRRYDLALEDQGEAALPDGHGGIYSGAARHCRGRILPYAGFWRATAREDERPAQLDVWIAPPRPGLRPVPVHMQLSAPRGTLGFHLTDARRVP
jgi:hypothetical protein